MNYIIPQKSYPDLMVFTVILIFKIQGYRFSQGFNGTIDCITETGHINIQALRYITIAILSSLRALRLERRGHNPHMVVLIIAPIFDQQPRHAFEFLDIIGYQFQTT